MYDCSYLNPDKRPSGWQGTGEGLEAAKRLFERRPEIKARIEKRRAKDKANSTADDTSKLTAISLSNSVVPAPRPLATLMTKSLA